jgi:hypothetical protein
MPVGDEPPVEFDRDEQHGAGLGIGTDIADDFAAFIDSLGPRIAYVQEQGGNPAVVLRAIATMFRSAADRADVGAARLEAEGRRGDQA